MTYAVTVFCSQTSRMTKSELISAIANKQPHLLQRDVELAINNIRLYVKYSG
jgi:nucleoid DNA-binding protein